MTTSGCAAGPVLIHAVDDNLSLIVTPQARRLMVPLAADELRRWLVRCDGHASLESLVEGAPAVVRALFERLQHEGCLAPLAGALDPVWLRAPSSNAALDVARLRATSIVVIGTGALAQALAYVLAAGHYRAVRYATLESVCAGEAASDSAHDMVVAAFDHPAADDLQALDRHCEQAGLRWLPLRWQDGRLFAGPVIAPGAGANFADLLRRRRAAERDVRVHDASWVAAPGTQPPATAAEWQWMAAAVALRLERWLAQAYGAAALDAELEIDPIENTVAAHTILPLPNRADEAFAAVRQARLRSPSSRAGLVDPQTGIITRLREVTGTDGMPPALNIAVADVADMHRVLDWRNDRRAFGASWTGLDAAIGAATGEAVERYCGNWVAPDREVIVATYEQLQREGRCAIDPDTLVLYTEHQYRTPGFPFAPFRRDSRAGWVAGWSLSRQCEIWVPAFLVYVTWHERQAGAEPLYAYPNLTGIAGGETPEYAMLSGLEEVIERDTCMIWWAHAQPLPALPIGEDVRALYRAVEERYEARLIPLPNMFSVPVLAAAVRDRLTGWMTIGSAVRHTAADAAYKALAEAFCLQQTCRSLDDGSACAGIVQNGVQNFGNLKPWREDRHYLDSYRSDFHDVVDLICQQQLHLDRRAGEHVARWVNDTPERDWETLPCLPMRDVNVLRGRVEAAGHEVICVDVTTRDVAALGLHVRRMLVPGLVANFPAAFPQWGRERIQRAGVDLGWREQPCAEADLNVFPLPHA